MIDRIQMLNKYANSPMFWLDLRIIKNPCDCWTYQDIIIDKQPDVIIECGTEFGGSALFLSSVCELIDNGRVITIDIKGMNGKSKYNMDRITSIKGSSTDPDIIDEINNLIDSTDKVMVILDSDHGKVNVLKELKAYELIVSIDQYMVVEDTYQGCPKEAIDEFLKDNNSFIIDKSREWSEESFNIDGYLLRVK